jgi:hypothetical protein
MAADIRLTSEVDANGVKKGFAKIQNISRAAGERVGRQFSKSFNNQINKFLGVGAILALGRSFAIAAKSAEKLQLESITSGLSTQQLEAMKTLAEKLGSAFTSLPIEEQKAFADQLIASGDEAFYTSEQIELMTKAAESMDEVARQLKTTMSTLFVETESWATKAATKLMLFGDALKDAVNSSKKPPGWNNGKWLVDLILSPVTAWKKAGEMIDEAGESPNADKDKETTVIAKQIRDRSEDAPRPSRGGSRPSSSAPQIQSDQLQRIGLFVGGAGNPAIAIAKEQVVELKRLNQQMREQTREFREAFR